MSKGLPYFKFWPSEWLTGDICFENLESQGLFINICAWYWQRNGELSLADIEKRYNKATALDSLSVCFFNVENGMIKIAFLDEQFSERKRTSKTNSENGMLGGRPKTKATKATALFSLSETKAKRKPIEENRIEENRIKQVHPLQIYIKNDLKNVSKLKSQLTFAESERLIIEFDKDMIWETLLAMENYTELKKYTSVNLTLRKWIKQDFEANKELKHNSQYKPNGLI